MAVPERNRYLPVFDALVSALAGSRWAYLILLGTVAGSAVFPPLPSESMIITSGVLAGSGWLRLPLVMAAGATGAFLGDNAAYLLGRTLGERAIGRVLRGERARRSLHWAQDVVGRYGGPVVVIGRFVPGGRTAVSLAAGSLAYPWRKYALFSGIGSVVWAVYGSLVGYVGGETFQNSLWLALLVAAGIAVVITACIELLRRRMQRRR